MGFSFPINERAVFHLNYGNYLKRPGLEHLIGQRTTLFNENLGTVEPRRLGNPRLEPEETKSYDVGLVFGLSRGFTLDLSGYYKDVKNLIQRVVYIDANDNLYETTGNRDYADVRGFSLRLNKRQGFLSGSVRYHFSVATGKNSSPTGRSPIIAENNDQAQAPSTRDILLNYDRRHALILIAGLNTPDIWGPGFGRIHPLGGIRINILHNILLANGIWRDEHLVFDADGMEGDTITVRAETPGQVILTGTSRLRIGGRYLKVEGLWFHRGALEGGHVIAFRINQNRPAHHSRLTNCAITEYNPPNWLTGYKWVSIYGAHNRVDHNYFADLQGDSSRAALPIMNGVPDSPLNRYFQVKNAHIANNTFVDTRVTILYGLGMDSEKSLPPQGVSFVDNVVYTDSPAPVVFAMAPSQDITWRGNVLYRSDLGVPPPEGIQWENPKLLLEENGLWRPDPTGPAAGKGATPESRPLTPEDVGPAWLSLPWTPRVLSENEHHLPDFSYAGYHWGERPPPELPPTINVTDFGATGDDMNDDTNAFKHALAAAQAIEEPVVLHIPAERYHLSDILFIDRSDFVLRGAGSGENGTVIAIEKPLGAMDIPPVLQEMRQSLIEKDKQVSGLPASPFSQVGGVFWTRLPDLPQPEMLTPIVSGMRGAYRMDVSDATGLEAGQMVRVAWFTPNDAGLPPCSYEAPEQKPDSHPENNPCNPPITQDVTITGVVDNTVSIKEPLLHGLSPEWRAQLTTTAFLREVGIEHLRIKFADVPYAGHHLENGYNAFYLTGLRHGWIRNVHIRNADAGILSDRSSNLSLENLTFTGRTSHYNVHMGDVHHVLVKDFEAKNPSLHPVGFGAGSRAGVFTRGRILQPSLDQHRGFQHQNLFDDLTLVENRNHSTLFRYSGETSPEATYGTGNTFWNIRISFEHPDAIRLPAYLGAVEKGRAVQIIGLKANVPIRFEYGPDTYIEGVNRTGIAVPSLYRYQLHRRLGGVTTSQQ